jgi:hypothetical protein
MLTLLARRRAARDPGNVVFGSIGWLFADLMFALAMAFLVATTVGQPPREPVAEETTASPSPSPSPSPTRTQDPVLELEPVEIKMDVDWTGLLNGEAAAKNALAQKIRSNPGLKGRRAGLVLTFGGASGGQDERAITIANRVADVLRALGKQGFVFRGTVYRPFLDNGAPPTQLKVDVYLFKR